MIYILFGPPGNGKSYFATRMAVLKMLEGKRVYSNYPILYKDLSSYVWEKRLIHENVTDSIIIMDEAYRDVGSRDFKNFGPDMHSFFATNRHNGLDIYVIAQHPNRVDVIIREMCNQFLFVRPFKLPFMRPLWFVVEAYADEQSMTRLDKEAMYSREHILFRYKYANAYDTHAFRRDAEPYQGITWSEKLRQEEEAINTVGANNDSEVMTDDW